ncbi:MAG: hypothetical protein Tsb007_27990 [Rhizobacter sp.]
MEKVEELEAIHGLPQLEIRFTTGEERSRPLEDVGLYLFDLTVVFELHVAKSMRDPQSSITRFSLHRNHSRVTAEQRLRVQRISLASPLEIVAVIAASTAAGAAAIWSAVQAVERLAMLPLNREKTRAEIAKLNEETRKLEYERLRYGQVTTTQVLEQLPDARNPDSKEPTPEQVIESAERRLESHGIRLQQIEIRSKSNSPNEREA